MDPFHRMSDYQRRCLFAALNEISAQAGTLGEDWQKPESAEFRSLMHAANLLRAHLWQTFPDNDKPDDFVKISKAGA